MKILHRYIVITDQGIFLDGFEDACMSECGTQRMINQIKLTMERQSMSTRS